LIALQFGLLFGLLSVTSLPIDFSHADLWVGSKEVLSVDLGRPIDSNFIGRLTTEGVEAVEEYYPGLLAVVQARRRFRVVHGLRLPA